MDFVIVEYDRFSRLPARQREGGSQSAFQRVHAETGEICVHAFDYLSGRVNAFLKERALWLGGTYVFTVEWYEGNDLLHLIALDNGQFAFLPHHKLKFHEGARQFAGFRKMRTEWKV